MRNCTYFDVLSTKETIFIEFRVKSHYENSVYHLSPIASISIAEIYALSESTGNSSNVPEQAGVFPYT
jgi:hypothetical protein